MVMFVRLGWFSTNLKVPDLTHDLIITNDRGPYNFFFFLMLIHLNIQINSIISSGS